jgi:hypothetical protein
MDSTKLIQLIKEKNNMKLYNSFLKKSLKYNFIYFEEYMAKDEYMNTEQLILVLIFVNDKKNINIKNKKMESYDCETISLSIDNSFELEEMHHISTDNCRNIPAKTIDLELLNKMPVLNSSMDLRKYFSAFESYLSFTIEYLEEPRENQQKILFQTIFKENSTEILKIILKGFKEDKFIAFLIKKSYNDYQLIIHNDRLFNNALLVIERNYKAKDIFKYTHKTSESDFISLLPESANKHIWNSLGRKINDF